MNRWVNKRTTTPPPDFSTAPLESGVETAPGVKFGGLSTTPGKGGDVVPDTKSTCSIRRTRKSKL